VAFRAKDILFFIIIILALPIMAVHIVTSTLLLLVGVLIRKL